MPQGKYKKLISKIARKGVRGYPIATIAFYGPTSSVATKLVCGIVKTENAEAEAMKKWFSENDVRKSEAILREVFDFINKNEVQSVGMLEQVIGCPHEEGIDYPEGESCPKCSYWQGRDRFTHEILH